MNMARQSISLADDASGKCCRFKSTRSKMLHAGCTLDSTRMRSFPFFESCSEEFLVLLAPELSLRIFQPGQEILIEGELGEMTYILVYGEVEVGKGVASFGAPAMFGESPLLMGCSARRTATVCAKNICDCRAIHQRVFNRLLDRFPDERFKYQKMAKERNILKDQSAITWNHFGRRIERSPQICPFYVRPYRSSFQKLVERIADDKASGRHTPRIISKPSSPRSFPRGPQSPVTNQRKAPLLFQPSF